MFKPSICDTIRRFLAEEEGATAVEYAVMMALIIGVCIGSVTYMSQETGASFDASAAAISGAWGN